MTELDIKLHEILVKLFLDLQLTGIGPGDPRKAIRQAAIDEIKALLGFEELKPLEERRKEFHEECKKLLKEDRSNAQELTDFFKYWSAVGSKKKKDGSYPVNAKMKFEKAKEKGTFDIPLRYATWKKNQRKFTLVNMLSK